MDFGGDVVQFSFSVIRFTSCIVISPLVFSFCRCVQSFFLHKASLLYCSPSLVCFGSSKIAIGCFLWFRCSVCFAFTIGMDSMTADSSREHYC